jgi:glutathione S-transferase
MLRGMPIKLYGHDTSPYVRRIRVLLAEKGLDFTRDADSWMTPTAEVLRINPILRVPALVDGEQSLFDSKLIATYLYDRYPQAMAASTSGMPPFQTTLYHPDQRYDDENILHFIDAALDSAINVFVLELDGVTADRAAYLGRQGERIRRCMSWLEERLGDRATFHEGRFAFIDVALTCALDWFTFRKRYPVQEHPGLVRFLDAHRARPTLAATHPSLAQNPSLPRTPAAAR